MYHAPPTLHQLSPTTGPIAGGTVPDRAFENRLDLEKVELPARIKKNR